MLGNHRSLARDVLAASVASGLAISALLAGGCATDGPVEPPADEQRNEVSSSVSAATWTDGMWPFTIERGELVCVGPADDPGVFILTENGNIYALNPAAIRMADQVGAIADLDPIWRWHDPDLPTAKVNVSPMIVYALSLC
jgi:hypothetical protein